MNLKNITLTSLLALPLLCAGGCEEWKADEVLIQNIWQEVIKITKISPDSPLPEITFLEKSPKNINVTIYGRFSTRGEKVSIFLDHITSAIWQSREIYERSRSMRGCDLSYRKGEVFVYSVVAHELLHYALYIDAAPHQYHHRLMKERGYLILADDYIKGHFKVTSKCIDDITATCIKNGVEKEVAEFSTPTSR